VPRSPHSTPAACTRSVLPRVEIEIAYAAPELVMTSGWRKGSLSSSPAGLRASASFCSGERQQHVARLARDHDARSAEGDHPTELLQNMGGADQIDGDDGGRRCLGGRQSSGVDDVYVAEGTIVHPRSIG
jgi:hypothetical protein